MDASIIPLCLSLFDWAKYKTTKGALKLHAVLDYETGLPSYAILTDGKTHDVVYTNRILFYGYETNEGQLYGSYAQGIGEHGEGIVYKNYATLLVYKILKKLLCLLFKKFLEIPLLK